MPSVADICNTALSHIGDKANVTTISPPDGSAQAGYCATFYPIALGAMLEMNTWGFATRRMALAQVDNPASTWLYAYAYPNEAVDIISVLCPDALSDYSENFSGAWSCGYEFHDFYNPADNIYTPQQFSVESNDAGDQIILTNVQNAVLRYTADSEDPMKYSGLFVLALSYLLASMLAGPIIKGDAGAAVADKMLQKAQLWSSQAVVSDANRRRILPPQSVPWMAGR
jgi:hypothetical protein